jgi:hypothetical protein
LRLFHGRRQSTAKAVDCQRLYQRDSGPGMYCRCEARDPAIR